MHPKFAAATTLSAAIVRVNPGKPLQDIAALYPRRMAPSRPPALDPHWPTVARQGSFGADVQGRSIDGQIAAQWGLA